MSQWAPSGCVWSGFFILFVRLLVRSLLLILQLCVFFSSNMNCLPFTNKWTCAACFSMGGRFDLCFIFISTDRFLIAFERAKRPTLPFQWPHDRIHIYLLAEIVDFYFLPFWVFLFFDLALALSPSSFLALFSPRLSFLCVKFCCLTIVITLILTSNPTNEPCQRNSQTINAQTK